MPDHNEKHHILAINPGSGSTKIGILKGDHCLVKESEQHSEAEMIPCKKLWDQLGFRYQAVAGFLRRNVHPQTKFDAIVGRGGLLRPLPGGVYQVTHQMLLDAERGYQGQHPANLGCALADAFAEKYGVSAFVVDPVSTYEMHDVAKISGHPKIERKSLSHALNIHYVSRMEAKKLEISLKKSRFVIAHLGGGFSIAPVLGGKIIDVNDANNEGPFSTTRSGSLPTLTLSEWIINSGFSVEKVRHLLLREGGLASYLGSSDGMEIAKRIHKGDKEAEGIINAMAYQIGKEIAAMSSVLRGDIDAIILTGGLTNFQELIQLIHRQIDWIAPVKLYPGEYEMEAMASAVNRILTGEEKPRNYPGSS